MTIDPSQSNAIRHKDGPAMILAGPGSGKTTVITHRVEYLISHHHIDPSSILVITFSRAAAEEMRERFLQLSGRRLLPVTFGTFHSVFFHILKCAYGLTARNIAGGKERIRFIREYIRRLRIETDDGEDLARSILSDISRVKNTIMPVNGLSPAALQGIPLTCDLEAFCIIFEAYGEFLRQNGLIDFDDMLLMTRDLFKMRPDILEGWQKRFGFLLVDEFQDINRLQYEIIRMLALPENNLFIVGDDDQSIYRFRGSDPGIMLNFKRDYPEAEHILLNVNYRSVPEIVKASGNLISHNRKRFAKDIRAASAKGREPVTEYFVNQRSQDQYVIDKIRDLNIGIGIPLGEIAVLFRTNDQPQLLKLMMERQGIPFTSKERTPCLYDHWIVRDLNTYISLACGDRRRVSFLRVMNRPNRHLSREGLPFENVSFDAWRQYYGAPDPVIGLIDKLESDLSILAGLRPFSAVNYIQKAMGYEDYIREYAGENRVSVDSLFEILERIREDVREFDTFEEWFTHQENAKKEWEKICSQKNAPDSSVMLSTLHASKGLEFDTVFIVDVNENVIPDKKAVTQDDIEEERRLFYVGMTRAKRRLYILCSGQIRNKTAAPSRFLGECTTDGYPQ